MSHAVFSLQSRRRLPQSDQVSFRTPESQLAKGHIHYLQQSLSLSGLPVRSRASKSIDATQTAQSTSTIAKPLPFQHTRLGRLPGEIREKIYEQVLTISKPPGDSESVLVTKKDIPHSCLAILATCRQTYLEARHVFYASNTLRLANSADFLDFLKAIGPIRRANISSLHLENLIEYYKPLCAKFLDKYCLENNIDSRLRLSLENYEDERMTSAANKALKLLKHSTRLRHIRFEIENGHELTYTGYVSAIPGLKLAGVDFADNSNWVIRESASGKSWYLALLEGIIAKKTRGPLRSYMERGQKYTFELRILPPLMVGTPLPQKSVKGQKTRSRCKHGGDIDDVTSITSRFDALKIS